MSIQAAARWFREDYFTFERRVVGINSEALNAPVEQGKIKYINLFPRPMITSQTLSLSTPHTVPSHLILESQVNRALRIASFALFIIPLIGGLICFINWLCQLSSDHATRKEQWESKFVPFNNDPKAYTSTCVHTFIHVLATSGIDPVKFLGKSFLAIGPMWGRSFKDTFYFRDYISGGNCATQIPSENIAVPLAQRYHFYLEGEWLEEETMAKTDTESQLKDGATVILAPLCHDYLPKQLRLYLESVPDVRVH